MATAIVFKPSKWFSNRSFKLLPSLPRRPSKSKSKSFRPTPSPSNTDTQLAKLNINTVKEHDLLNVFRHFDADGDGKISSEELGLYFASIGESEPTDNVLRVIKDFDSDGDSLLEFSDFVRLVEGGKDHVEDDLRTAFELFQVENGAGFITPKGLQRMLGRLGDDKSVEECVAMIRVFDLDGNGKLDFQEFQRMMS